MIDKSLIPPPSPPKTPNQNKVTACLSLRATQSGIPARHKTKSIFSSAGQLLIPQAPTASKPLTSLWQRKHTRFVKSTAASQHRSRLQPPKHSEASSATEPGAAASQELEWSRAPVYLSFWAWSHSVCSASRATLEQTSMQNKRSDYLCFLSGGTKGVATMPGPLSKGDS